VLFSKFVSVSSVENSDRIISYCGKSLKDLAEFQWKRSKKLAGSWQTLGMENRGTVVKFSFMTFAYLFLLHSNPAPEYK
jgi:hypothetical protein